jgi:uncharacterized protein YjiS (DUF1127 family)
MEAIMTRSFTNTRFSLDAAFGALGAALSVSALLAKAEAWSALTRQRRALADLDEARLRDIGVTAGQAAREAARPFWDAPKAR